MATQPLEIMICCDGMSHVTCCVLCLAAVTAGLIASDIGAKTICDVEQYYKSDSAYHTIADAIKRRMEVPSAVSVDCSAGIQCSSLQ